MSHTQRIMKRIKKGQKIVPTATLIGMDADGRVVLVRNEMGLYELPQAQLQPKLTLEDSLRKGVKENTNLDVGTLTLLSVETENAVEDHPVYIVQTIYYSEDFVCLKDTELFSVDHLPMNIETQSRRIIEAYVASVQASFMRYISMNGELF